MNVDAACGSMTRESHNLLTKRKVAEGDNCAVTKNDLGRSFVLQFISPRCLDFNVLKTTLHVSTVGRFLRGLHEVR